jgi:hypothetical protein
MVVGGDELKRRWERRSSRCVFTCCEADDRQRNQRHRQELLKLPIGGWNIPAGSRLSSLTLEASDALLPPLRSHGQQLGELMETAGQPAFRRYPASIALTGMH